MSDVKTPGPSQFAVALKFFGFMTFQEGVVWSGLWQKANGGSRGAGWN